MVESSSNSSLVSGDGDKIMRVKEMGKETD